MKVIWLLNFSSVSLHELQIGRSTLFADSEFELQLNHCNFKIHYYIQSGGRN